MNSEEFVSGLDRLFAMGDTHNVEDYLCRHLDIAGQNQDTEYQITVLNEMSGYYRSISRHRQAMDCADQALKKALELGLSNTLTYGTILLNSATACRAAGEPKKAMERYQQTQEIYCRLLPCQDPHWAALYNNMAAVCQDLLELDQAGDYLCRSISILKEHPYGALECATVQANLAAIYNQMDRSPQEVLEVLSPALEILRPNETDQHINPHYPAALATQGAVFHRQKLYPQAIERIEQAMEYIKLYFGENRDYAQLCINCGRVYSSMGQDLIAAKMEEKGNGILSLLQVSK